VNWPTDSRPDEPAKKQNSFELAATAQQLLAEGANGFDSDEELADWQTRLDASIAACDDKIGRCVAIYRRAVAEAQFQATEAQRHSAAVARHNALAHDMTVRLGALLRAQEAATGNALATVSGSWVKLARRNSVRCEVPEDDAGIKALPVEFQRIKIEPDKAKIKEALTTGRNVLGCALAPIVSESVAFGK